MKEHPKRPGRTGHSEAGFSLVELMITSAIFVTGMVMLLGNVVTASNHRQMTDLQASSATFHHSTMEDIRGRGIDDILTYGVPLDDPVNGTVYIPGIGNAKVACFAVVPDGNGGTTMFELGVDDPLTVTDPPNPIEIQVEVTPVSGSFGVYEEFHYRSSTLIRYED